MFSSLVTGNIQPSDSQMNAITSILQGHDTIACLPTIHGNSPIKNCKQRMKTNNSVLAVPSLLFLMNEQMK